MAAVVDRKIFFIHGGIAESLNNRANIFDKINQIRCPLRDPEVESPLGNNHRTNNIKKFFLIIFKLAWELLWNDPLRYSNFNFKLNSFLCYIFIKIGQRIEWIKMQLPEEMDSFKIQS